MDEYSYQKIKRSCGCISLLFFFPTNTDPKPCSWINDDNDKWMRAHHIYMYISCRIFITSLHSSPSSRCYPRGRSSLDSGGNCYWNIVSLFRFFFRFSFSIYVCVWREEGGIYMWGGRDWLWIMALPLSSCSFCHMGLTLCFCTRLWAKHLHLSCHGRELMYGMWAFWPERAIDKMPFYGVKRAHCPADMLLLAR